jgi:hypothetical protein
MEQDLSLQPLPAVTTLSYPSDSIPPFHPFEVGIPDGWTTTQAPGSIVVFLPPHEGSPFRPNLLIGADRVPVGADLAEIAAITLEDAESSYVGFAVEEERETEVAEQEASLRLQTFDIPDLMERILQLQVVFVAPRRFDDVDELFRVHATCVAADADRLMESFVAVVKSFRFTDAQSTAARP